ncbi:carotenoid oxygenase family protein [Streptomyces incarnatus]
MARTSRCLVLVLGPAFFDLAAALNGGSVLAWGPEQPTRIALIPRDGCLVCWVDDEAFWLWHAVNAYDTRTAASSSAMCGGRPSRSVRAPPAAPRTARNTACPGQSPSSPRGRCGALGSTTPACNCPASTTGPSRAPPRPGRLGGHRPHRSSLGPARHLVARRGMCPAGTCR